MTAPAKPKTGDRWVGLREIATILQVEPRTPTIWRNRTRRGRMDVPFPEPITMISNTRPVFSLKEVLAWAKKTGRLPTQRAQAAADRAAAGE